MAAISGAGMMLTFDNFLIRIERFGRPSSRCWLAA
jgi:hypothetical protein